MGVDGDPPFHRPMEFYAEARDARRRFEANVAGCEALGRDGQHVGIPFGWLKRGTARKPTTPHFETNPNGAEG